MNRRIFDIAIILVCTSIFVWCALTYIDNRKAEGKNTVAKESPTGEEKTASDADITIWYIDSKIEPYLEEVVHQYSSGTKISLVQVSVLDYLENINKLNLQGEGMPDLYVLDSEMLEKAYLAGLTQENTSDVYNADNYPSIALSAATYHEHLIAYPFYFDTGFLVYNKEYVAKAPNTFDDILAFAETFDAANYEGVENILKWDAGDLLLNYGFIGGYLEFGGDNGDNSSVFNFNHDKLINCLDYYHNLYQYFSIDIDTIDGDTVVDEFIKGKTIFSILSVNDIAKLEKSEIEYGLTVFPDLTDDLESKNLSATKVIAVNPYSKNKGKAQKVAKYLTYDKAEEIYKLSGYMSSRKYTKYSTKVLKKVMGQYEESVNLPKLMSTRDFWVQLQNMLNSVWKGSDIDAELETLENKMISYQ